jgi:endonuclease/exonuclease/phosphatase family metal-dependent hydrolase
MHKTIKIAGLILVCFSFSLFIAISQTRYNGIWLTYNMQNFFDDTTSGTEYPEFTAGRWNRFMYEKRLIRFGEVFRALAQQAGQIQLAVLQEVESALVVQDLIKTTPSLHGMQSIFAKHPDGATGIALLSRYPLIDAESYDSSLFGIQSRPLLKARVAVGKTIVTIIACHLPSRRTAASAESRQRMLRFIAEIIERDKQLYNSEYFMIAGDFNTAFEDNAHLLPDNSWHSHFVNLWQAFEAGNAGSYLYRGQWQKLDHIILSKTFLAAESPLKVTGFHVFKAKRLFSEPFSKIAGFSTATGYGYSDHLPLVAAVRYNIFKVK